METNTSFQLGINISWLFYMPGYKRRRIMLKVEMNLLDPFFWAENLWDLDFIRIGQT